MLSLPLIVMNTKYLRKKDNGKKENSQPTSQHSQIYIADSNYFCHQLY